MKEIDTALGNYVRGQFIVCVIVGVFAYMGYMVIGMPYALLLAIVAAFNVVPYLGPFLGAAPAVVMASTVSIKMVLMVIVNAMCQVLESNVISPQVVGRTLHLHPVDYICTTSRWGTCRHYRINFCSPVFAVMKVLSTLFSPILSSERPCNYRVETNEVRLHPCTDI